jgi:hypothetical protein
MALIRRYLFVAALAIGLGVFISSPAAAAESGEDVGVVDSSTGVWYLRDASTGGTTSFYYGKPGDYPFMGDWDCDGVDTPGLYRRSDGFVYLRNSNTQGIADISFFFGNPGDLPVAGDFNGDGCDTVSIYRPREGRFYIINRLGSGSGGLGAADFAYYFGNPGDKPFVGDFDADGVDEIGLHRESTGLVYFRFTHTQGVADKTFIYGNPGDVMLAGRWQAEAESGADTVGIFRPGSGTFHLSYSNDVGNADESLIYGNSRTKPVSGRFGSLPGGASAPPLEIHLVSRFTTFHDCCQNRVTNIQTMARALDGYVVMPGETFSIDEVVGPRTSEKGYLPAPYLIDGEGACCAVGGGVSQFGTTIHNAVFWGGYRIDRHQPHSGWISRYPLGVEATLVYSSIDFRFTNDTRFPVTIRTGYNSTSITVELWGNQGGWQMTGHHPRGARNSVISVLDWGGPEAKRVSATVTGSAPGTVKVTRTLTQGGVSKSQSWWWTYVS